MLLLLHFTLMCWHHHYCTELVDCLIVDFLRTEHFFGHNIDTKTGAIRECQPGTLLEQRRQFDCNFCFLPPQPSQQLCHVAPLQHVLATPLHYCHTLQWCPILLQNVAVLCIATASGCHINMWLLLSQQLCHYAEHLPVLPLHTTYCG